MNSNLTAQQEKAARKQRFREGLTLHDIESNPLTTDEVAMFEMFDREGWSDDQRRAYIIAKGQRDAEASLAAE